MAPEGREGQLLLQLRQHRHQLTDPQQQRGAQPIQRLLEFPQGFRVERPLAGGDIRLGPKLGLHHHQGQHGTAPSGLPQGPVVVHPQIPFEQNNLHGLHGRAP